MQKTTMGALLLSLLVFPGAGHFLLKRWVRGILWAGIFGLAGLGVMAVIGANVPQMLDAMMSPNGDVPMIDGKQLGLGLLFGMAAFASYFAAALDCWWISRSVVGPAPSQGLSPDEQQVLP